VEELDREYLYLFNTISKTIDELHALEEALKDCQQTAEDLYLERCEVERPRTVD
jgi:hypothetical protein